MTATQDTKTMLEAIDVEKQRDALRAALEALLHDVSSATGRLRLALASDRPSGLEPARDLALLVAACKAAREALNEQHVNAPGKRPTVIGRG